jgi:hypothetical protein
MDNRSEYQWTPARIMLGGLVVLAGLSLPGYVAWTQSPRAAKMRKKISNHFDINNLTLSEEMILSGGPGKDGLASLRTTQTKRPADNDPSLHEADSSAPIIPISESNILPPTARVVGVTVNNESRAYPIPILNYHEAVNDELGGVPICVVFCPLCDSVTVVDRRIDGHVLEFGISGHLANSNVLLYDRKDHALWSQVKLEAISGPYAGRSLKHLNNWEITTLAKWKQSHPKSTILSTKTGNVRSYMRNPYMDYFRDDMLMFEVEPQDNRMPRKTRVIGIRLGDTTRAYVVDEIRNRGGFIEDTIGGQPLRLEADATTNTVRIVQAPADAQVVHTFWFAWFAFHPQTQVVGEAAPKLQDRRASTTQPS